MTVLDRTRNLVTIGISIGAVLFTGLNYWVVALVNSPDIRYYYTISQDLGLKEEFGSRPQIQNTRIVQSEYYRSLKKREDKLGQGTLFLWLVICNEGKARARDCHLKTVTYRFRNQSVGFGDTPSRTYPHKYQDDKYGPLPHSIFLRNEPGSIVVLLCEHFVPSEGKDPDNFIKENMGFAGFTVETRIKSVIGGLRLGGNFKTNYATEMWP